MHAKVHLLIARSCRLPRCNSLDDKIRNAQVYSIYIFCDVKICTSPYIRKYGSTFYIGIAMVVLPYFGLWEN